MGIESAGDTGGQVFAVKLDHRLGPGDVTFPDQLADGFQFGAGIGGEVGVSHGSFDVSEEHIDVGALQITPVQIDVWGSIIQLAEQASADIAEELRRGIGGVGGGLLDLGEPINAPGGD